MIFGVNGESYLNLDKYIDIKKLKSMHMLICHGLARSEWTPTHFPRRTKNRTGNVDMNDAHIHSNPRHATVYKNIYDSLGHRTEKMRFAELANDVILSGYMVSLRSPHGQFEEGPDGIIDDQYVNIYDNCYDEWRQGKYIPLMKFIKELPFRKIGRIIIFISNPGVDGQIHRDVGEPEDDSVFPPYKNKDVYKGNHFIWMNPTKKKKFFVYDEAKDERHYIKSTTAFFNSNDFHGSDSTETSTYSIRVDGRFNKEMCNELGLDYLLK